MKMNFKFLIVSYHLHKQNEGHSELAVMHLWRQRSHCDENCGSTKQYIPLPLNLFGSGLLFGLVYGFIIWEYSKENVLHTNTCGEFTRGLTGFGM